MKSAFTVLFFSFGLLAGCSADAPEEPAAPEAPAVVREIHGLETEEVRPGPVQETYEAPGTVRSKTTTTVAARTSGNIVRMAVSTGDRVRQGQSLAQIDSREAEAQLRGAEAGEAEAAKALEEVEHAIRAAESALRAASAQRDLAASTLERYRTLQERRSVSPQEFDEVQARFTSAVAEADRANEMLDSLKSRRQQVVARIDQAGANRASANLRQEYAQVISPLSGIITAKHAEPGMVVGPGSPLLTIEDDAHYQVEVPVDEDRISAIRVGMNATVRIEALPMEPVALRITEILPRTDPVTRTATVRLDLPARSGIRSGMFARVLFPSGSHEAITVPENLVLRRGQLTGVWTQDGDTVRYRLIITGKTADGRVEVLSGLEAGDRLILSPPNSLADGQKVRP